YLVRHGQSVWNGEKRITGRRDPPLSAVGRHLSERLAAALRGTPLARIFTSALTRSIETASPLAQALGLPIDARPELDEQGFGVLEGRHRDARDPEAAGLWEARRLGDADHAVRDGESFNALLDRVRRVLPEILAAAREQPVLVVGHRHTNRALLCALLGWSHEQARGAAIRAHYLHRLELGPPRRVCSISLRERDLGRVRLGLWL
ncbi:MAG: histidine phosphatase family protein, partial [Gammaproteobacteria bacterium]